jgi:8-oxo-dGTP diphosphatase
VLLKEIPTWIPVVAARLCDPAGRILLQEALPGKRHAGMWELPGGKVDPGETPRSALVREVHEELGLSLAQEHLQPSAFVDDEGEPGHPELVLILYTCTVWRGLPEGRDGQVWGWFDADQARGLPLAPLDRRLLDTLDFAAPA